MPSEVIHTQTEVIGTFISPETKELVSSCSQSILDALAGREVKNYHEIAKDKAIQKAAAVGRDGLTRKQRLLLNDDELTKAREVVKVERKAQKAEAKYIELAGKVKAAAQESKAWRDIISDLSLHRYKQYLDLLKRVYEDNFRWIEYHQT